METPDHNSNNEINDFVSFSAQLMAAVRARETQRNDRLFEDPFAAQLAGSQALDLLAQRDKQVMNDGVPDLLAIRTRFFDDLLMSAISNVRQVVILAAGMDTRAFRLTLPEGTCIYELDQPEVLAKKAQILQQISPNCQRKAIAVDFTKAWVHLLVEQGYQLNLPSVWLIEGLLMYLTESQVHDLLQTIWDITVSGSCCGADVLNVKALEVQDLAAKYWRSGFDYPEEIFAFHGWNVKVVQPGEEGVNFGRITQQLPPRDILDIPRSFFVIASK